MGGEKREKIGIRYLHVRTEIIDYRVSYIYFTIKKEGEWKKERKRERERERERESNMRNLSFCVSHAS